MKYIKLIYLATWTLIYQLPTKTIAAFSAIIISTAIVFWLWLLASQQITAGNINAIQVLPDGKMAVLSVGITPSKSKHVLAELSSIPEKIDEFNWFVGYGTKRLKLNDSNFLVVEKFNIITNPLSINTDFNKLVSEALNENKKIAVIIGIVLFLFALVFIQISTATLMGIATFTIGWHILNIGSFYNYWQLSDVVILPICSVIFIIGTAIGMRNNKGKSAYVLHRIASVLLLILFMPYLQSIYANNISELIFWLLIPLLFFPELIITLIGTQLIAFGLGLNNSENIIVSIAASLITIWIHRHKYSKSKSRPFKKTKTKSNGEMILEPSHF